MTVFKTFLKILNKNKFVVLLYTIILLVFGVFNMATSENSTNFVASKPDILIINKDEEIGLTKNLINYIKDNANIIDIKLEEDAINDALFYRDVNYILYIPENYRQDVLNDKKPEIQIKSTGDYQASYAEMLMTRYIKIQNIYASQIKEEAQLIEKINHSLENEVQIEVTSKLDTNGLSKASFYYNFASYSILAGAIYVICLILASFHEKSIRKRRAISSMKDKKHNRILLLSNGLFAITLWLCYTILSFLIVGETMFSFQGIIYMMNSFVFTMCALTIAFLIATVVNNKNAINGIVNVIALGSSFLCGAFVPVEWLPKSVLTIAHLIPTYWYIQTNELMKTIEEFNLETLTPVCINMGIMLLFSIVFIMATNIISKKKRRIG